MPIIDMRTALLPTKNILTHEECYSRGFGGEGQALGWCIFGNSLSDLTAVVVLLSIWCSLREIRGFELVYRFIVLHHEGFH